MEPHLHHRPPKRVKSAWPRTGLSLFILVGLIVWLTALPSPAADLDLVLHFDSDSAELSQAAHGKLQDYLAGATLGSAGKLLVVGHADEKGERKHNLALSRQRAAAVKRALIDRLDIPGERVLTVGQGNDAPVAANDSDRGRARNRRVVVRLIGVAPPEIQRRYGGLDPRLVWMDTLLSEADADLRLGRPAEALAKLDRAAGMGGDQYGAWHTRYGIAGFLGGQPPHKLRGYFETALTLDPYDSDARDFLGRIEARQAFHEGRVAPYMGRTPGSAIRVTTRSQVYEYLRLFEVEPLRHHTLNQGTIDAWRCRDGKNRVVRFYFDTTPLLEWAYPAGDSQS